MKKIILKTVLCLSVFICLTTPANAFVFSDISALAQRAVQFIQTATHYTASVTHYKQVVDYAKEFNQYRNQFDNYWKTFNRIYTKINRGDYARDFNVSDWNWLMLDDHILRTWRSYNQASWDAQLLALRSSRLIDTNPAYRRYVERLEVLTVEKAESLKKEEADILIIEGELKQHMETLDKLKETNEKLTIVQGSSTDPIDAAQLQSLNNLIVLEQVAIQVKSNLLEQRRREAERANTNFLAEIQRLELEARQGDEQNLEHIMNFSTR